MLALALMRAVHYDLFAGSCKISVCVCAAGVGALLPASWCRCSDAGRAPNAVMGCRNSGSSAPCAPAALTCTSHAPALQGAAGAAVYDVLRARPRMRSGAVRTASSVRPARAARHQAALPLRQWVVRHALAVGLLAARPCSAHANESAGCQERQLACTLLSRGK